MLTVYVESPVVRVGLGLAKQSACIALTIAIQRRTALASNVGRKCNSPKLSKDIHNMLPNCTTLCIMNKTTKQKQNSQKRTTMTLKQN